MTPLDLFPGSKTYILAVGMALTALGAWLSGSMELGAFIEALFAAGAMITFRKAMK